MGTKVTYDSATVSLFAIVRALQEKPKDLKPIFEQISLLLILECEDDVETDIVRSRLYFWQGVGYLLLCERGLREYLEIAYSSFLQSFSLGCEPAAIAMVAVRGLAGDLSEFLHRDFVEKDKRLLLRSIEDVYTFSTLLTWRRLFARDGKSIFSRVELGDGGAKISFVFPQEIWR